MKEIYLLKNISFLLNNIKIYTIYKKKYKEKIGKTELKNSNKLEIRF
jgi:hypothetical protein